METKGSWIKVKGVRGYGGGSYGHGKRGND